jgi:hypothetical protein
MPSIGGQDLLAEAIDDDRAVNVLTLPEALVVVVPGGRPQARLAGSGDTKRTHATRQPPRHGCRRLVTLARWGSVIEMSRAAKAGCAAATSPGRDTRR